MLIGLKEREKTMKFKGAKDAKNMPEKNSAQVATTVGGLVGKPAKVQEGSIQKYSTDQSKPNKSFKPYTPDSVQPFKTA